MQPFSLILIASLLTGLLSLKENAKKTVTTFPCGDCDYIVRGFHNDGEKLNFRPGQVICLDASLRYEKIKFTNLKGTADNPIIIRNCGGMAVVSSPASFAIKFEQSENFRLLGDGDDSVPY